MGPRSKREYTEATFLRYKKASRKEKKKILDEFCATCEYHRKHAIRMLRDFKRFIKPKKKKRGRHPVYHDDIILPLKRTWLAANLPRAKHLKAIFPDIPISSVDRSGAQEDIPCNDRQVFATCAERRKVYHKTGDFFTQAHFPVMA